MEVKQPAVADASQSRHRPAATRKDRVQVAAELLQSLLIQRDSYAYRWQKCQRRATVPGTLNQAAVAQAIAQHLWDSGDRPDSEISLPRSLKDRIHRALHGEAISLETLDWFIDAFKMTDEDADRLRACMYGEQPRPAEPIVDTLRAPSELPLPQRHRTVAVFERRIIGAQRRAVTHHTTRAITACDDIVYSYPCRQFPDAKRMTVLHGGRIGTVHKPAQSSPVVEIALSVPLRKGFVGSLGYAAEFGASSEIAVEYRQVAHARADNVDITIQFDQAAHPRRIWWVVWDDYRGGGILDQEAVCLDQDGCAHHFVPYLKNAAAGFRWDW